MKRKNKKMSFIGNRIPEQEESKTWQESFVDFLISIAKFCISIIIFFVCCRITSEAWNNFVVPIVHLPMFSWRDFVYLDMFLGMLILPHAFSFQTYEKIKTLDVKNEWNWLTKKNFDMFKSFVKVFALSATLLFMYIYRYFL